MVKVQHKGSSKAKAQKGGPVKGKQGPISKTTSSGSATVGSSTAKRMQTKL